jgi:hypothetical protein
VPTSYGTQKTFPEKEVHSNYKVFHHFRLVTANQIILTIIKNEGFDSPVKVLGARKANLLFFFLLKDLYLWHDEKMKARKIII